MYSQMRIDLHIDHTAASSPDCSALHKRCLSLLREKGNIESWWVLNTYWDIPNIPSPPPSPHTFESISGSWSKVLVGVKLEGQLPVRLLQILIASVFGNAEDFIKVFAILYPAKSKRIMNVKDGSKKKKKKKGTLSQT